MSKWSVLKQASRKRNTELVLKETGVTVYLRPPSSAVVIEFAQVLEKLKLIPLENRPADSIDDERNQAIRAMVVDSAVDSEGEQVFDSGDEILKSVPIGDLKTLIENTLELAGVTVTKNEDATSVAKNEDAIGAVVVEESEPKNVSSGIQFSDDSILLPSTAAS